ncbi:MAG: hypothetical protein HY049_09140 [Acidobacteria bacterium]|nr:hypothetical protein [Acidobacteriota bacterium]
MPPGAERQRILDAIKTAILDEIQSLHLEDRFTDESLDVGVRSFDGVQQDITVWYSLPPFGPVVRNLELKLQRTSARFSVSASQGPTPNSSEFETEEALTEHYRQRLHENSLHLTVPLRHRK